MIHAGFADLGERRAAPLRIDVEQRAKWRKETDADARHRRAPVTRLVRRGSVAAVESVPMVSSSVLRAEPSTSGRTIGGIARQTASRPCSTWNPQADMSWVVARLQRQP